MAKFVTFDILQIDSLQFDKTAKHGNLGVERSYFYAETGEMPHKRSFVCLTEDKPFPGVPRSYLCLSKKEILKNRINRVDYGDNRDNYVSVIGAIVYATAFRGKS